MGDILWCWWQSGERISSQESSIQRYRIMSWKILIIMDNVYKGFSFIVCLTIVTLILIATFRLHTACLLQVIVSIYWVKLFVSLWLLVICVSQTSLMVGGFRSKALWPFSSSLNANKLLWIETHQPWARIVIHQSLTNTLIQIVCIRLVPPWHTLCIEMPCCHLGCKLVSGGPVQ